MGREVYMKSFKNKLIAFMYGRYGVDSLYYALLGLWMVCWFLRVLTQSIVFDLLLWAILVILIYRVMSRNLSRRRAENEKFLKLWKPVQSFGKRQWMRIRDCRTHVYRRCPECGSMLRLPHRRGTHTAVCPKCSRRFETRIIF